jgi:TonB family protein
MPNVGDLIDRYVIEAVIGEGGMGRVYRALDPRLGRRVALKLLLADGTNEKVRSEAAARMIREARAAAAFNHPNVIAIHDVGEFEGNPYITMELVSGSTLRAYIGDANLSNEHRLEWLLDVARGLGAAHRAGLVHRDIKPENVMVTTDGVVKILDFGIARRTEDPSVVDSGAPTAAAHLASLTAEGMMIGTPQYMPPEQLQGEPLDGRADQFAWGVMAWELFAGVLPWGASKNGAQLVAAVLATPVRPLRDVVPSVDQAVSDAVAKALSKNRDTRFKTMEELLVALEGKRASAPLPSSQDVALQPTAAQPSTPGPAQATLPTTKPSARPPEGALTTGNAGSIARTDARLAAQPPRGAGVPRSIVALGIVAAVAVAVAFALGSSHRETSVGAAPSAASSAAMDAALATGPLVGLCTDGTKNDCSAGSRAWCDVDDRVIACCAPDLVATGKDGVCDCAPGGVDPDAGASACPKAKESGTSGAEAVVDAIKPKLKACYTQGLEKNESLAGSVVLRLELAPTGSVYHARIKEGRMASPLVQKCLLDEMRQARFEPPPGGQSRIDLPIRFEREVDDAPSIPGRHPCRGNGTCTGGAKAWCDADERELACCADGLVAVSRDGMCDCPPGGVTSAKSSCPRADKKIWEKALAEVEDTALGPPLRSCINAADAGRVTGGGLKVSVTYDPDGLVGSVHITQNALPQVFVQRCLLDAYRGIKAPPPPDGTWTTTEDIDIAPRK